MLGALAAIPMITSLSKSLTIHKIAAITLNLVIIAGLIYIVVTDNSDKSPIIFMLGYPLLVLLNVLTALGLWLLNRKEAKIYKQISLGLLALFIPLVYLISQF